MSNQPLLQRTGGTAAKRIALPVRIVESFPPSISQPQSSKRAHLSFFYEQEPKIFFANERLVHTRYHTSTRRLAILKCVVSSSLRTNRTFLSWLNFSVVLGGLAVGLLNFGDRVGKISAGMFTVVGKSPSSFT